MQKIEEPLINLQIVWLFLTKLNELNPEERAEILNTIKLINHPIFLTT